MNWWLQNGVTTVFLRSCPLNDLGPPQNRKEVEGQEKSQPLGKDSVSSLDRSCSRTFSCFDSLYSWFFSTFLSLIGFLRKNDFVPENGRRLVFDVEGCCVRTSQEIVTGNSPPTLTQLTPTSTLSHLSPYHKLEGTFNRTRCLWNISRLFQYRSRIDENFKYLLRPMSHNTFTSRTWTRRCWSFTISS